MLVRDRVRRLVRGLVADAPADAGVSQLGWCGLPTGGGVLVSGSGVFGCGSCRLWFRCPVCVTRFWGGGGRARLLNIDSNVCSGGGLVVCQRLSLAHSRADDLRPLLEMERVAWRQVMNDRQVRKMRAELGAFPVLVREVKWNPVGGWNPHLHANWVVSEPAGRGDVVDRLCGLVGEVWASALPEGRGSSGWSSYVHGGEFERGDWAWYYDESDPYHPLNDCGHAGHEGCRFCSGDPGELFGDRAGGGDPFGSGFEPLGGDGGSVDPGWSGDGWGRFGAEGRGVWGAKSLWDSLGVAALVGPEGRRGLWRVKLREFVVSTRGFRLINDLTAVERRLGVVAPVGSLSPGRGGGRVLPSGRLVSGRLWAVVLLRGGVDVGRARGFVVAGDRVGLEGLLGEGVVDVGGSWRLVSEGVGVPVVSPVGVGVSG